MTDLTRLRDFAQKKTVSVSAARLKHSDVADTTLQTIFNLPEDALIVDAGVLVHVAGQASLTADFGFAGGAELGNDLVLSTTGYKTGMPLTEGTPNTSARIPTLTGKDVTVKFSADPSAGEFTFICEYIEFALKNGNLTAITA